jgi:3-hydroxyisobutyrate dehydrogenase
MSSRKQRSPVCSSPSSYDVSELPSIGWVGVGKMGGPMCARLLAAGYSVLAFDQDPRRNNVIANAGASIRDTLADTARGRDVCITMIPDDRALRDVYLSTDGLVASMSRGTIALDMSTVSPSASQEVAEALRSRSIAYVRAPVSGSTALARDGELVILTSGPQNAVHRCLRIFEELARSVHVVGEEDEARWLKLAVNVIVAGSAALFADAFRLGAAGGINSAVMVEAFEKSVVGSPLLSYKRELLLTTDALPPAFTIGQMLKDLALAREAAELSQLSLPILERINNIFVNAANNIGEKEDFFSIARIDQ